MKSSDYWQNRFKAIEEENHETAKDTVQSVTPAFDKAQRQIEGEINAWYQRYAQNNQISLQEAKIQLNAKELKELKWDIDDYIKAGHENAVDQRWMKELENASAKYHITRLEALKIRTQNAAELAFGNEQDALDQLAARIYTDDYYHTAYEIQKGLGIGWDIGTIDQNKLDKLLNKPWTADGQTFSNRIWKSKTQLIDSVSKELTQMCILGKAPDEAIKNLASRMNVSKNQAGRLIMTESAYFASAAQKDCFNSLDVEMYEIVATLDSHTSEICQQMDGQHFDMKDFQAGVTAPPFHVWCRSITVPYFDDEWGREGTRAARGADGKTYQVPADMKYSEWKNSFVDGNKQKLTLKSGTVKIGDSDGYTTVDRIEKADINDKSEVKRIVDNFCNEFGNTKEEHSLVISKDGFAYYMTGTTINVNPSIIGTDRLIGSIGIHNHPVPDWDVMGDSFSLNDLIFSAKTKTGIEYLISGERRNAFEFTMEFTEEEIREAWEKAYDIVLEKAFKNEMVIYWDQEEIVKVLNDILEGFIFYENF